MAALNVSRREGFLGRSGSAVFVIGGKTLGDQQHTNRII